MLRLLIWDGNELPLLAHSSESQNWGVSKISLGDIFAHQTGSSPGAGSDHKTGTRSSLAWQSLSVLGVMAQRMMSGPHSCPRKDENIRLKIKKDAGQEVNWEKMDQNTFPRDICMVQLFSVYVYLKHFNDQVNWKNTKNVVLQVNFMKTWLSCGQLTCFPGPLRIFGHRDLGFGFGWVKSVWIKPGALSASRLRKRRTLLFSPPPPLYFALQSRGVAQIFGNP